MGFPTHFKSIGNTKMSWQPGNILKKGRWGFYKSPKEGIESVYENFGTADTSDNQIQAANTATTNIINTTIPTFINTDANVNRQELNTVISGANDTMNKKKNEIVQGVQDTGVAAYNIVDKNAETVVGSAGTAILGAGDISDEQAKNKFTDAANREGSALYSKVMKDVNDIQKDAKSYSTGGDFVTDIKATLFIFKDFFFLIKDIVQVLDVSAHPNVIDYIGDRIGEGYYQLSEGTEDKDHYKEYILAILYFFFSITLAYVASENWFYMLIYDFSKNSYQEKGDDTHGMQTVNIINTPANLLNSLKKTSALMYKCLAPVFFPVVVLGTVVEKLKVFCYNNFSHHFQFIWAIRMALFFIIFLIFQFWTQITTNPLYVAFLFFMAMICVAQNITMFEVPEGNFHYPALFAIALFLYFLLVFLFSITKSIIFIYLASISFGYILRTEGSYFQTVDQMRMYYNLLYDDAIIKNKGNPTTQLFYHVGKFMYNSWFTICLIFIVLSFLLLCIRDNSNLTNHLAIFTGCFLIGLVVLIILPRIVIQQQTKIDETTIYEYKKTLNETIMSSISNPLVAPKVIVDFFTPPTEVMNVEKPTTPSL